MATPVQVAATLYLHELLPRLKKAGIAVDDSPITAQMLAQLSICKAEGLVSTHEIRQFMDKFFDPASPA